jgi:hypothetical protein
MSRTYVVQPKPAWCLCYALAPNWHLRGGVAARLGIAEPITEGVLRVSAEPWRLERTAAASAQPQSSCAQYINGQEEQ